MSTTPISPVCFTNMNGHPTEGGLATIEKLRLLNSYEETKKILESTCRGKTSLDGVFIIHLRRLCSSIDAQIEDLIHVCSVENSGAENPEEFMINATNWRNGSSGKVPGKMFIVVGVHEMCGCVEKMRGWVENDGKCGCRYENLQQSLANRDERNRGVPTRNAGGFSGASPSS